MGDRYEVVKARKEGIVKERVEETNAKDSATRVDFLCEINQQLRVSRLISEPN